jgi:hypothetical protein
MLNTKLINSYEALLINFQRIETKLKHITKYRRSQHKTLYHNHHIYQIAYKLNV